MSSTHVVLVVDDDPLMLKGLQRTLKREPYRTLAASDAAEALSLLEQFEIDLVVSDEVMPGMRGTEFLSEVREKYPEIMKILLTGAARFDVALKAINHGEVFRFLVKPCNPVELAMAIRQGLQYKDLLQGTRKLLKTVRKQASILDDLERDNPGISQVRRNRTGAIVIDEAPSDLDALLRELAEELGSDNDSADSRQDETEEIA